MNNKPLKLDAETGEFIIHNMRPKFRDINF